jgi:hypothetical protein
MASTTQTKPTTPAQRKALAAKIAKARENKMTGQAIRDQFGSWLTGPERRKLLREFGFDNLVAASYDRAEAKAKREAKLAEMTAQAAAKKAPARKPRKPAASPASQPSQAETAPQTAK